MISKQEQKNFERNRLAMVNKMVMLGYNDLHRIVPKTYEDVSGYAPDPDAMIAHNPTVRRVINGFAIWDDTGRPSDCSDCHSRAGDVSVEDVFQEIKDKRAKFIAAVKAVKLSFYKGDTVVQGICDELTSSRLYIMQSYSKDGAYSYAQKWGDRYDLTKRIFTTLPKIITKRLGYKDVQSDIIRDLCQRIDKCLKDGIQKKQTKVLEFKVVKGEDIKRIYRECEHKDGVTSCMTHASNDITLYTENPQTFKMLVCYHNKKIVGRAMLFIAPDGKTTMGRIYSVYEIRHDNNYVSPRSMMETFAVSKGWKLRQSKSMPLIESAPTASGKYPYMDNYCYGHRDLGKGVLVWSNKELTGKTEWYSQSTACNISLYSTCDCDHCGNRRSVIWYRPSNNVLEFRAVCSKCQKEHYTYCNTCSKLSPIGTEAERVVKCVLIKDKWILQEHSVCPSCTNSLKNDGFSLKKCGHYSKSKSKKHCEKCKQEEAIKLAKENPKKLPLYDGALFEGQWDCDCESCRAMRIEKAKNESSDGLIVSPSGDIYRVK